MLKSLISSVVLGQMLCFGVVASEGADLAQIARPCGWSEIDEAQVLGPIEAAAPFRCGQGCTTRFVIPEQGWGAYLVARNPNGSLDLVRWDEAAGVAWQRDLEFPIFISLSSSVDGELVAACAWEDESVLGFVFDRSGMQRFREPLDPLSQLTVLPDAKGWSVTWAIFDWPEAQSSQAPAMALVLECTGAKWSKKTLASGEAVWWYRPLHHLSETPHPALCYPAFALTAKDGTILFSDTETGSFVTFFADIVCGDDKFVLVKEGVDAVGNQAREMIALTNSGQELWRIRAHRQSSQVSGFLHGQNLALIFAGKDIEYRNATTGALIASDTLNVQQRERLFPIQGFLRNDEGFIVLGRQLSVQVHLDSGKAITDCEPLEIGGALSFDGQLCTLYSTLPDSSARICRFFKRAE